MPEGDSIFRLADRIRKAFLGETIARVESFVVEVDAERVVGAEVSGVDAHGKNLFVRFSSGHTLVVHLMMYGRVFVGAKEGAAGRRSRETRAIFLSESSAMRFERVTALRLVRTERAERDPALLRLGPDPLRDDWSAEEALLRLRSASDRALGDALLDQRILAGVGNVLKSEILYLAGADPFAKVAAFDEASLASVLDFSAKVLRFTVKKSSASDAFLSSRRVTRVANGALRDPHGSVWVYGRSGRPCYVCASPVRMERQGIAQRSTYYCPRCQPRRRPGDVLVPPKVGEVGRVARMFPESR